MNYIGLLIVLFPTLIYGQDINHIALNKAVDELIDSMWVNPISFFNRDDPNWQSLCKNLQQTDSAKLNQIAHSIFSKSVETTKGQIENGSEASEGFVGWLNKKSHNKKLRKFNHQIEADFTNKNKYPEHKIVLIEGDSWFEYPLFLHEITDQLAKMPNLAIYSLAAGGDWAANMISSLDYQIEYKYLEPDIFIISGGGNDMLQDGRIINYISDNPISKQSPFLIDYREYVILRMNNKPVPLCKVNYCPSDYHLYKDSLNVFQSKLDSDFIEKIVNGRRYLNKEFYQLLVSLKLEYKILFESIRKIAPIHFESLKIITQGYDYAIPNSSRKFGARLFMNNGQWLKKPLKSIGITDQEIQESIVMALMFDFNEMLIELGKEYPNIYHVDVRGFTQFMEMNDHKKKGSYWYDELHPTNLIFMKISQIYYSIIMGEDEDNKKVFNLIEYYTDQNAKL